MFGTETFFFYLNIFAYLVVELEEKLVELEGLWGKWKSRTWRQRRTCEETGEQVHTSDHTETLLNEDSGSEQTSAAEVPV